MTASHAPGDFSDLRATVAALQAEVALLKRRRRNTKHLAALLLVALLMATAPLSLLAASFTDLPAPDQGHNANINAIAAAGITKGCNPPANDQFCPFDPVTRQEMASFLARLGGLGSNPPVANAQTAQTVPDNSVTAAKLSAAGVPPGQVLVSGGSGVAWEGRAVAQTYWYSPFDLRVSGIPPANVTFKPMLASPAPGEDPGPYVDVEVTLDNTANAYVVVPLPYPDTMAGAPLRLQTLTLCFSFQASGVEIDRTTAQVMKAGVPMLVLTDPFPPVSATAQCYDRTPLLPVELGGALYVQLRLHGTSPSPGEATLRLYALGLKLTP